MCIDMDSARPDFVSYNKEGTFDADKFLDWAWLNEEANYMPYVREDENHGVGGINPGIGYTRLETFTGIFRSGVETEEEL